VEAPVPPGGRLAAVAAVLRVAPVSVADASGPRRAPAPDASSVELLFIKRAEVPHDPWSGHMAFPGGRHEPGDASLAETALRETREELGLDLRRGTVLGALDDLAPVSAHLPRIVVRPFVVVMASPPPLVPSHEVAATFWEPVDRLRSSVAQATHVVRLGGREAHYPAYRVGPHLVWGMTERILRQLLTLFDAPAGALPAHAGAVPDAPARAFSTHPMLTGAAVRPTPSSPAERLP
jgi:8-oxo-dGTP pyrophosphatase MutT (NUDIX family)